MPAGSEQTCAKPSAAFAGRVGAYASAAFKLTKSLSVEIDLDLFSYNAPTDRTAYQSKGIMIRLDMPKFHFGWGFQRTKQPGESEWNEVQRVPVYFNTQFDLSDGLTIEVAPIQAFAGFSVDAKHLEEWLLPCAY